MKNTKRRRLTDCGQCTYTDLEVTDDPCFKCLSGYFGKTEFVPQKAVATCKNGEKRVRTPIKLRDENTPLPWGT